MPAPWGAEPHRTAGCTSRGGGDGSLLGGGWVGEGGAGAPRAAEGDAWGGSEMGRC
uniref:Uncharacterized protein n=1 Tax=Arundo donax TaxID=35708 RepID=A0A0A9F072_ARUDO